MFLRKISHNTSKYTHGHYEHNYNYNMKRFQTYQKKFD